MKKAIRDNRVCLVPESLEEARAIVSALAMRSPLYIEYAGKIVKISKVSNESITIIFDADVRTLEGVKE